MARHSNDRPGSTMHLLVMLALAALVATPRAQEIGAGTNLVSSYVFRDTTRAGLSVQPSAWIVFPAVNAFVTAWTSVRLIHPRLDAVAVDGRAGRRLGERGWGTLGARWEMTPEESMVITLKDVSNNDSTYLKAIGGHAVELSATAAWFQPPYRPTLMLVYDIARGTAPIAVVSIPYTLRLGFLGTMTFVPEVGIAVLTRWGLEYASFTALVERRWGRLTLMPIGGVVPKGGLPNWILWGGLHVSVSL